MHLPLLFHPHTLVYPPPSLPFLPAHVPTRPSPLRSPIDNSPMLLPSCFPIPQLSHTLSQVHLIPSLPSLPNHVSTPQTSLCPPAGTDASVDRLYTQPANRDPPLTRPRRRLFRWCSLKPSSRRSVAVTVVTSWTTLVRPVAAPPPGANLADTQVVRHSITYSVALEVSLAAHTPPPASHSPSPSHSTILPPLLFLRFPSHLAAAWASRSWPSLTRVPGLPKTS